MTRKSHIYTGIGGWTFAPWRGVFYPKGLTQANELAYASQPHLDRDQRHLLWLSKASQLSEVGVRDARWVRLLAEGLAFRHQPPGAGRGGRSIQHFFAPG